MHSPVCSSQAWHSGQPPQVQGPQSTLTPQLSTTSPHCPLHVWASESGTQQAPVAAWQMALASWQQPSLQQGSHGSHVRLLVQVSQVRQGGSQSHGPQSTVW